MAYRSVWWYSPVEYGAGVNPGTTWPNNMEQYRRPEDERQRDLPTEHYTDGLYQSYPRMGQPTYRATKHDKPSCVNVKYPEAADNKPRGYHGRMYYEHGKPTSGPLDDLYWLEHPSLAPTFQRQHPVARFEGVRNLSEVMSSPANATRVNLAAFQPSFPAHHDPTSWSNVNPERVERTFTTTPFRS